MNKFFLASTLLAWGCITPDQGRNPVYVKPSSFVNERVQICGYMIDGANILEDPSNEGRHRSSGISISESGPLGPRYRGRVCVEGTISRMGCQTGPNFCTDAAFDYGIRIERIIAR